MFYGFDIVTALLILLILIVVLVLYQDYKLFKAYVLDITERERYFTDNQMEDYLSKIDSNKESNEEYTSSEDDF